MGKNPENFKAAEFKGYVCRALEDIAKDLKEMKEELKNLNNHVNEEITALNKKMGKIELKQATSKREWTIYKSIIVFTVGAIANGGLILFFQYLSSLI